MCQTEWESYQYRLECPNGDPSLSQYDSGGKKRCIHHHPHSKLAILAVLPSTVEVPVHNSSTAAVVDSKGSVSQTTPVDRKIAGKESNAKEMPEVANSTKTTLVASKGSVSQSESVAKDMGIHRFVEQKELSVLKSPTKNDLYLQAIQEMYPGINTGQLSSNLAYYENWAQVRATGALKAFTTVKKMIDY